MRNDLNSGRAPEAMSTIIRMTDHWIKAIIVLVATWIHYSNVSLHELDLAA